MKINQITIKNFKGFEEETFLLNPRFTVLIGDNAKGKTAFLQAMSVAMGSFFLGIDNVGSRTIQESEVRTITIDKQPKPQKPVVISAEWRPTDEERNLWKSFSLGPVLQWKREKEKAHTNTQHAKQIKAFAESLLRASRRESGVVFPLLAYYGTGRLWALHEKLSYQKQEEGVVMAYTHALSAKASPREFLEWYKTQEDQVQKFGDPQERALLEAFKKTVVSLVPDQRWQDMAFDRKADELVGLFTTDEGQKEILRFSQLSDGFRNVVALAGDLAFRAIQLNPHLGESAVEKTPGIVLIDELDMHLHPNWQRSIVADLKTAFPHIQFVATTHSPFIVQSLDSNEIWNLDKAIDVAPNQLKVDTVATEVMGVSSPFSQTNEELYQRSKKLMDILITEKSTAAFDLDLKQINDPAIRAFLELQKVAKGK